MGSYTLSSRRWHSSKSKTVRQLQTVLGIGMSGWFTVSHCVQS